MKKELGKQKDKLEKEKDKEKKEKDKLLKDIDKLETDIAKLVKDKENLEKEKDKQGKLIDSLTSKLTKAAKKDVETAKQQAETAKQQAETAKQQAKTAKQQARTAASEDVSANDETRQESSNSIQPTAAQTKRMKATKEDVPMPVSSTDATPVNHAPATASATALAAAPVVSPSMAPDFMALLQSMQVQLQKVAEQQRLDHQQVKPKDDSLAVEPSNSAQQTGKQQQGEFTPPSSSNKRKVSELADDSHSPDGDDHDASFDISNATANGKRRTTVAEASPLQVQQYMNQRLMHQQMLQQASFNPQAHQLMSPNGQSFGNRSALGHGVIARPANSFVVPFPAVANRQHELQLAQLAHQQHMAMASLPRTPLLISPNGMGGSGTFGSAVKAANVGPSRARTLQRAAQMQLQQQVQSERARQAYLRSQLIDDAEDPSMSMLPFESSEDVSGAFPEYPPQFSLPSQHFPQYPS